MNQMIQEMRKMRLDKMTFYSIIERFIGQGIDRALIAENFTIAFEFESNPQIKSRIIRWSENRESFHKIAERRHFQKRFGHVPSIEEIASFYRVDENDLIDTLNKKDLAEEIQPIGRWSRGGEMWHGYTIDVDGMIELDKIFGGKPEEGISYWSL